MAVRGASSLQANNMVEPVRALGDFAPSIWGDRFTSIIIDTSDIEAYDPEINVLKEEVRRMMIDPATRVSDRVNLINHVHRLGLSYHFDKEIDSQLEILFTSKLNLEEVKEYDLFMVSLQFRVFRQFGYKMPCDVFKKFTDNTGKFYETLASDVRGILSLYEASQLRIRGEDILDEALAFSTAHLRNLVVQPDLSPQLMKQVVQALKQPFNKGMPRMEAALYISTYEEEETRNELLLKLAKLDFNKLQLLYLHELSIITNWYKDMEFTKKAPHAKDRVVECYFWMVGAHFEARYSIGRMANAKAVVSLVTIDDLFDAYGRIDELQLYTDATNRWEESAMDMLPVDSVDRWRFVYKTMLEVYGKLDELLTGDASYFSHYSAKQAVQQIVTEYNRETIWSGTRSTPTFKEYMKNALITSTVFLMALNIFKGMGEIATKDVFDWHRSQTKIRNGAETIVRLQDDLVTYEAEEKRGHFSAVHYYMKQYSVSKAEAIGMIEQMIENAWKDMNEDCLKPLAVPRDILLVVFNLARIVDLVYKHNDGFTIGDTMKGYIETLFLKPMVI